MANKRFVLSLFSSAGIGELGVKACGLNILLSNELLKNRCALYQENYPETDCICGDIWSLQEDILNKWATYNVGNPFLIYATPPCQGMSFNSVGKRLQEIREGRKPKDDPRNRLIIPTIQLVKQLKPQWLLLENVKEMQNTIIPVNDGEYKSIIEYIKDELGPEYVGGPEVVNCADYGIPQTRIRLITIFTCSPKGKAHYEKYGTFMPTRTHSENGENGKPKWVSLKDAIGSLPPLSSERGKNQDPNIPWHIVPVMKEDKFWWVQNTPINETAYNNQCVVCGYSENPRHGMFFKEGRHISKKDTPIYCEKCGALLPRPTMIDKDTGERRMIKGFDSAYRRMSWDSPSPTLTQLFQAEASDKKIHPTQNRTLSIYEGLSIQAIADYEYKFSIEGKPISLNACCQVIGESVPPRLIENICRNIISIEEGK
ncbi:MAG: DNA cytosine methyltransferase [Muribaculaceae bacterium]|nr:DNA cytosine methyltransferase [Muribaculaceae bacterium]